MNKLTNSLSCRDVNLRMQMKYTITQLCLWASLCLLVLNMTSCETDPEPSPIPEDLGPAITIIAPESNNFLAREGESVAITFRLADNEYRTGKGDQDTDDDHCYLAEGTPQPAYATSCFQPANLGKGGVTA